MKSKDAHNEIKGYGKWKTHWKKLLIGVVLLACVLSFAVAGGVRYYKDYLALGWHERKEGLCYRLTGDSGFAIGVQEIDGQLYCFSTDGWLLYGWILYEDHIYYADENGILARGEFELDGKNHHFDPKTGALLVDWQEEEGVRRYFQEDGTYATGYREIDGIPYKFAEDGIPYIGMEETPDGIRLFTENGLAEGITSYKGETYYFVDSYMQHGLFQIEDRWYYFAEDGVMQRGWLLLDENKYYFGEDGASLTGTQTIEGETYYLAEDGKLINGWVTAGGNTYYYSSHGQKLTGWQTIDNKKYYFQDDGAMALNTTIEMYTIDGNGVAWKNLATPDNLDWYLDEILDSYGRSPSDIHKAVYSMLSYKSTIEGDIEQMACDAINNRKGACWNYSSLGYMLLKRAGYQVYYIRGTYLPKGNPHRWLYVEFEDGWYYMDCLHDDRLKLTDAQYASLKFDWDRSGLPGY